MHKFVTHYTFMLRGLMPIITNLTLTHGKLRTIEVFTIENDLIGKIYSTYTIIIYNKLELEKKTKVK